jgi:prophage antirepressor-like protein
MTLKKREVSSEMEPTLFPLVTQATITLIPDFKDGQPYFVAKDVAEALAFKCVKSALKIHCQSKVVVRKGVAEVVGLSATSLFEGSASLITLIPESDLYRLVMRKMASCLRGMMRTS